MSDETDKHFSNGLREGAAGGDRDRPHSDPITTFGGLLLTDREIENRRAYDKGFNAGRKNSK